KVATVDKGSAAAGKIQPGDKIVAVNGKPGDAQALVHDIGAARCAGKPTDGCKATEPVTVTIEHDGEQSTFAAVPRYDAKNQRMRLGLTFVLKRSTVPPGEALSKTVSGIWGVTKSTASIPANIVDSQKRKQLHGTAGVYKVTEQSFKSSAEDTISII